MYHRHVNPKLDGPDPDKTQPSHWNDDHAWYPYIPDDGIELVEVIVDYQFPVDWDGTPPDLLVETDLGTIFGAQDISHCFVSGITAWLQLGCRAIWIANAGIQFQRPVIVGSGPYTLTWQTIFPEDIAPVILDGARLRFVVWGAVAEGVDPWPVD